MASANHVLSWYIGVQEVHISTYTRTAAAGADLGGRIQPTPPPDPRILPNSRTYSWRD